MGKIKLSAGGYTPISEGEHIFKIINTEYDEDFGKIEIEMITGGGRKHTEKFILLNNEGEINEKALNAFSFFAKTALNNFNLDEIDHEDLKGCYISATVTHYKVPSSKDPAKTMIFPNLSNYKAATGFEKLTEPPKGKATTGTVNLDEILK